MTQHDSTTTSDLHEGLAVIELSDADLDNVVGGRDRPFVKM
ncbi:hypothetical protein ABTX61_09210 [Amycolatopsis japonica]